MSNSASSVAEMIGGIDNGGGINNNQSNINDGGTGGKIYDENGNEIDPVDLLWLDPDVGNHIYGITGILKVAAAAVIWWVALDGGAGLTFYSLWAWAVGLLSVAVAWIPVVFGYALHFINTPTTDSIWLYCSLLSVDGPMVGYVIAIVIVLMAYFEPINSGLYYTSEWHFWLGVTLGITFTALSITFQILMLPGIRIWHNIRSGKDVFIDSATSTSTSTSDNGIEEANTVTFIDSGDSDFYWDF